MCVVMAVAMFLFRGFSSEIELTLINLIPYLLSAISGVALVFLYLYLFPSQRKNSFLTFFIPGIVFTLTLILTGLADFWLIEELIFALGFIFGGQELSNTEEKSL